MAIRTWKGGAAAVAQVSRATPANVEVDDIFTLTLTNEAGETASVSFTATAATVANVTAGLAAAWSASNDPRFAAITASDQTTYLRLTAKSAGVPFYLTSGTIDGGGANTQTLVITTTTPSQGPYDYNCPANWVEGAVPDAGKDVVIAGAVKILYGLDQSGVAISDFTVGGYSGTIGALGSPLKIDPDSFLFQSTGQTHIDIGSAAIAPRVTGTAGGGSGSFGLYLAGSAMTTLKVEGGSVGLATAIGQTAAAATILVSDATVFVGSGVTMTTYSQTSGAGTIECAATTISADSGTLTVNGSGAVTTVNNGNAYGGATMYLNTSGTITTLNAKGGTTTFAGSRTARTVTTLNLYCGASVKRDPAIVTVGTLTQSDASTIKAE